MGAAKTTKRTFRPSFVAVPLIALALIAEGALYYTQTTLPAFIALAAIFATLLAVIYILYANSPLLFRRNAESTLFLIMAIAMGLVFCFFFTPMTAPDEAYHYRAAYELSNVLMCSAAAPDGYTMMRPDDIAFFLDWDHLTNVELRGSTYGNLASAFQLFAQEPLAIDTATADHGFNNDFIDFTRNPPQNRILAALGIMIGRFFGLGALPTFYLGRLANLAGFIALVYLAVRITPIGKKAIMTASLLPITLHLAASYSYDAPTIAMSFLLTALIVAAIKSEAATRPGRLVVITVIAALLAPCKVVYVLIAFAIFLVPNRHFRSTPRAIAWKIGIVAVALSALLAVRMSSIIGVTTDADLEKYDYDTESVYTAATYSLADLLGNPLNTAILYANSFGAYGIDWLSQLAGGDLAWFQQNIEAPWVIWLPLLLALLASALASRDDESAFGPLTRVALAAIAIVGWLVIMASLALDWTYADSETIEGLQGRYFLPFVPVALYAIRSKRLTAPVNLVFWCPWAICAITLAYILWMLRCIM